MLFINAVIAMGLITLLSLPILGALSLCDAIIDDTISGLLLSGLGVISLAFFLI